MSWWVSVRQHTDLTMCLCVLMWVCDWVGECASHQHTDLDHQTHTQQIIRTLQQCVCELMWECAYELMSVAEVCALICACLLSGWVAIANYKVYVCAWKCSKRIYIYQICKIICVFTHAYMSMHHTYIQTCTSIYSHARVHVCIYINICIIEIHTFISWRRIRRQQINRYTYSCIYMIKMYIYVTYIYLYVNQSEHEYATYNVCKTMCKIYLHIYMCIRTHTYIPEECGIEDVSSVRTGEHNDTCILLWFRHPWLQITNRISYTFQWRLWRSWPFVGMNTCKHVNMRIYTSRKLAWKMRCGVNNRAQVRRAA